jgi:hypothetical protein
MSGLSRLVKGATGSSASRQSGNLPSSRTAKKRLSAADIVFVLGLAVSGLTTWLQQGFATDRKGYLKSADDAAIKVCEIQTQINLFRSRTFETIEDELAYVRADITPLTDQVRAIQTPLVASLQHQLGTSVLAQSRGTKFDAKVSVPLKGYGMGACNVLSQAQENARVEAEIAVIRRLVQERHVRVRPAEEASLSQYVNRYSSKSDREGRPDQSQQTSRSAAGDGLFYLTSVLTLDPTFADPDVIALYLAKATPTPELTVERINAIRTRLLRERTGPIVDGYLEGSAAIPTIGPSDTSGVTFDVLLRQPTRPENGSFKFTFRYFIGGAHLPTLKLDAVEVEASGGRSARWTFAALYQEKVAMIVPEQRWEDSGHPTRCSQFGEIGLDKQFMVPPYRVPIAPSNHPVITIVGLKPGVLAAN